MKHRTLLIAWMLVMAAGCATAPKPAPGTAGLRVNVVAEPKAGARVASVSVYDSPAESALGSGAMERVDYAALDDIVVWIEPSTAVASPPPAAPVTVAVDAVKSPQRLAGAVSVGQRLLLRNAGARPGHFYSLSDGNEFDPGPIPPGGQAEFSVKSPGLIEIMSDLAKDPVAQIYAVASPWVAVKRAGESVDFTNLPPGLYRVLSWHPRLPGYEANITLSADQVATATIRVGVNALPKVGAR